MIDIAHTLAEELFPVAEPLRTGKRKLSVTSVAPAMKKTCAPDWLQHLDEDFDHLCSKSVLSYKDYLQNKKAWWQYCTRQTDQSLPWMDRTKFHTVPGGRGLRALLKRNEYLPFALIGDKIPAKHKRTGQLVKDKDGKVMMRDSYSFAELRLQDLVAASYALDRKEMRFCSISMINRPVHLYLDIDCSVGEQGFGDVNGKLQEVCVLSMTTMAEYFQSVMKRPMNVSITQFGPACTESKFSLHIHVPTEVFRDLTHLAAFRDGLVEHIKLHRAHTLLGKVDIEKFIDPSVYAQYSYLKMFGCRKPDRENITLYFPDEDRHYTLEELDCEGRFNAFFYELPSFALCSPKDQPLNEWPTVIAAQTRIAERRQRGEKINAAGLREEYFGMKVDDMQKAAESNGFELLGEMHTDDNIVHFKTRNIEYPRHCDVAQRDDAHKSWWVGCYVTKFAMYMTCAAPRCKGHRKTLLLAPGTGERETIVGEMIDSLDTTDIKSWNDTIKAMVQAGATKEQVADATRNTDGHQIAEHSFNNYHQLVELKQLKRTEAPLIKVLEKQGELDDCTADVWKTRMKAVGAKAARLEVRGDPQQHEEIAKDFPFDLPPVQRHQHDLLDNKKGVGIVEVVVQRTAHHIMSEDAKEFWVWNKHRKMWTRKSLNHIATLVEPIIKGLLPGLKIAYKEVQKIIERPAQINGLMTHIAEGIVSRSEGFVARLNGSKDTVSIMGGKLIELRTLNVRDRTRDDYYTFESDVTWVDATPDADEYIRGMCMDPTVEDEKELAELPENERYKRNEDKEKQLLTWMGYTVTGDTTARCVFNIVGKPGSGKSTLVELQHSTMGKHRSTKLASALIFGRKKEDPNAHTAGLNKVEGKHLGWMSETQKGLAFDVDGISKLVGDGVLDLRRLNKEGHDAENKAKFSCFSNHMGILPDDPVERCEVLKKLFIIELNHRVDTKNKDNIRFKNETVTSPSFRNQFATLAWKSAKKYYDDGCTFAIPDAEAIIDRYTRTSITRFVEDCLTTADQTVGLRSGDLLDVYLWYCRYSRIADSDVKGGRQFGNQMNRYEAGKIYNAKTKQTDRGRMGIQWKTSFFKAANPQCSVPSVIEQCE